MDYTRQDHFSDIRARVKFKMEQEAQNLTSFNFRCVNVCNSIRIW